MCQNCQNFQNCTKPKLYKIVQNCPNCPKLSKWSELSKIVKIVQNCQNLFQMSCSEQWLVISSDQRLVLCSKIKRSPTHSLIHSVARSPIELFWTAKKPSKPKNISLLKLIWLVHDLTSQQRLLNWGTDERFVKYNSCHPCVQLLLQTGTWTSIKLQYDGFSLKCGISISIQAAPERKSRRGNYPFAGFWT